MGERGGDIPAYVAVPARRAAGHVAHSAATIAVIGPAADNEFHRAQLDLGQATMAMLLAAADLALARELLGFPADRDFAFLAVWIRR